MEVNDFTAANGSRGSLQKLRRLLAKAVTTSIGNTAKATWLTTIIGESVILVTADDVINYSDLTSDTLSNNSTPGLLAELLKASSEAVIYGGDYKTQLIADLNEADGILTA